MFFRVVVFYLVHPLPGQESRNRGYRLGNKVAIKIGLLTTLSCKISAFLNDHQRLTRLKNNARRVAGPRAAFVIVDKVMSIDTVRKTICSQASSALIIPFAA